MVAILCTICHVTLAPYSSQFSDLLTRSGRPPAVLAPSQADSLACFASLACDTSPPLPRARSVANHCLNFSWPAGRSVGMITVSASAAAARGAEGCPMSEIWCYMTCYVTCYM